MALTLDYNYKNVDIYNAYLKISSITVSDEVTDSSKKYVVKVTYEIKATKDSDYFCIVYLEFDGNPDESLYNQSYNHLKNIYPLAIDN